jgi:hypothetical protein
VPVVEQSEYESANEALVTQAQGRPFGPQPPQDLNQIKHHMQFSLQYCILYDAENLLCMAQT